MTAITTQPKPTTLKGWLQSDALKSEVAKVLPKHMKPERMMRIAITALTRVPKLNDCTQESFVRCLLDLSAWGLEPNGRDAHLIPYGKECTLILDYKGLDLEHQVPNKIATRPQQRCSSSTTPCQSSMFQTLSLWVQ